MPCRLLVIPALVLVNLAVAGQGTADFDIQLIGTKPGATEWQVAAEKTGSAELRLLFQGRPKKYPLTIKLICPASSRECLIGWNEESLSAGPITINDPVGRSSEPSAESSGEKPDEYSGKSPLHVVKLTQLPEPAGNAKTSQGLLIVTDGKNQSFTKQLVFSFKTPSWERPPGSANSGPLDLKVDLSGKGLVRINTEGWKHSGSDKIGVSLSEFVGQSDGTTATVSILDDRGDALGQDASLHQLGYKSGDFELQLDASTLSVGQSYDGTLVFTEDSQALGYPPLTLKIERAAPAAKATLIAYPPLAPPDLGTTASVDVMLKEKSGDLPLQDIRFDWKRITTAEEREGPVVDRIELELVVGEKIYPLWPQRSASRIDIPPEETAILRLKDSEGDGLDVGRYRFLLELWAANTDPSQKTQITLDFDKRWPIWVPYVVLFLGVFASFAGNRALRIRSEAASIRSRIERFDKRIASIQEHCPLLPVTTLDAELERARLSMKKEYGLGKPWWSQAVNNKVKERLDVLDKCIPSIDKLGYLWNEWSQTRSHSMVEQRARGRLQEIASHMAQQMAYLTSTKEPFSNWVTGELDAMKEWTDQAELEKRYPGMVAEKSCQLLRYLVAASGTDTGLEKLERPPAAPPQALNEAPGRMESAPEWAATATALWKKTVSEDIPALQSAFSEWGSSWPQDGHQIEPGRIFAATRKLEQELKKPLWLSLDNLSPAEPDASTKGNRTDETAFREWAKALRASIGELRKIIKEIDQTRLSNYGVQQYLRHILRGICKTPPSSLTDAIAYERGVYVPLKLLLKGRENRLSDVAIEDLHNEIKKKLLSYRDPTRPPAWDDSDLEDLYTIMDKAAWNELQKRAPNSDRLRIVVETPGEGGKLAAYQLVHCKIDPTDAVDGTGFRLGNSHAFNASFRYEWTISPPTNNKEPPQKAHSVVTREPQVWIFAPWQGSCEISVGITPDRLQVEDSNPIEVKQPLKVGQSGLHKETSPLMIRELVALVLVLVATYGAGLASAQFKAATYGSVTAWIILFGAALALVKLKGWLDKPSG